MGRPWVSNKTAQDVLVYVHYAYPIILLFFFVVATTAHAVLTASKDEIIQAVPDQTGPGGKPLPRNTSPGGERKTQQTLDFSPARKLFFSWISVAAVLTFFGDGVIIIAHALADKEDNWWCGESVVVCAVVLSYPISYSLANGPIAGLCCRIIFRLPPLSCIHR